MTSTSLRKMNAADLRRWITTSNAPAARWLRQIARGGLRIRARARSGSVSAEMDRIVTEATSARVGSGHPDSLPRDRPARPTPVAPDRTAGGSRP